MKHRNTISWTSTNANEPKPDLVEFALSMCASGRLEYVSSTCCRLRMAFSAPGDKEWWNLDLANYCLPATALMPQCRLSEDPRLAVATILAIDAYLCGAAHTKATHRTIATIASTIAKFWEWGRINALYRAEDWTPSHFRQLERELGIGKWSVALQTSARIQALLESAPEATVIGRIDNGFAIREEIRKLIGTNQSTQELGCARREIHRYVQPVQPANGWKENKTPTQPTITWLLQAFWAANLLARLPDSYGFRVTPFTDPMARAKKLAKPAARTPTLSVEQAVGLLVHARKYVYLYSDAICSLVHEIARIASEALLVQTSMRKRNALAADLWEQSNVRRRAQDVLGVEVSMLSRGTQSEITVAKLVDMLMSSALILIAGLNARRKDEIIHRTVGLNRDSIRIINAQLQVYEGIFYIEKTFKTYVPYFVNQTTFDSFDAIKKLENAQFEAEQLLTGEARTAKSMNHSMFWSRSLAPTRMKLQPRVWFSFSFDGTGAGRAFTAEALSKDIKLVGGGAHIFRRFYAIIYFYRFEQGGLLSIRYQLAHLNCEVTRQYVTDSMIQSVESRIPLELRRGPDAVRSVIVSDWKDLDKELTSVGSEKLHQVISELLDGRSFSGGFSRLVERLHRFLMADVDYSAMDAARKATRVHRLVESRGHALRPLPHGDCAAGSSPARGAKCSRVQGSGPAPENATALVCAGCAYSWTSRGHLVGLKADLEVLDREVAEAGPDTLLWERRLSARDNLQKAIWLHERRLAKETQQC